MSFNHMLKLHQAVTLPRGQCPLTVCTAVLTLLLLQYSSTICLHNETVPVLRLSTKQGKWESRIRKLNRIWCTYKSVLTLKKEKAFSLRKTKTTKNVITGVIKEKLNLCQTHINGLFITTTTNWCSQMTFILKL